MLIDKGLDVNLRDLRGQTPLHYAARFGSIDCAKLLLEKGADVFALSFMDHSPLYMAMDVLSQMQFKNPQCFDNFPPPAMKLSLEQVRDLLKKAGASAPKLSTYKLPPQPLRARSTATSLKKTTPSPPVSPTRSSPPPTLAETPQFVSVSSLSIQDFGPQPGGSYLLATPPPSPLQIPSSPQLPKEPVMPRVVSSPQSISIPAPTPISTAKSTQKGKGNQFFFMIQ